MKNDWYIKTSKGQTLGPVSEGQCRRALEERSSLDNVFVRQGDSAWKPAQEVVDLFQRLDQEGVFIEHAGKIYGPFTESKFIEMVPTCDVSANWRKGSKGIWYPIQPIKSNPLGYLTQPRMGSNPSVNERYIEPVQSRYQQVQVDSQLPSAHRSSAGQYLARIEQKRADRRYTLNILALGILLPSLSIGLFAAVWFGRIERVLGWNFSVNRWNYERVEPGMTYEEVMVILGPGQEQSSSRVDGVSIGRFSVPSMSGQIVVWKSGFKNIVVSFINGRVSSKAQLGL